MLEKKYSTFSNTQHAYWSHKTYEFLTVFACDVMFLTVSPSSEPKSRPACRPPPDCIQHTKSVKKNFFLIVLFIMHNEIKIVNVKY